MVATQRLLKQNEIASAFGSWTNDLIPSCQDLDKYANICSVCISIVYLDNADDDDYKTVNFLHQSVKDFLLRNRPEADLQWHHTSPNSASFLMFQVGRK
jgi:hypothetical protein